MIKILLFLVLAISQLYAADEVDIEATYQQALTLLRANNKPEGEIHLLESKEMLCTELSGSLER